MPLTVTAAATRAAVTVAGRLGLPSADPVVLADGANVVVWLRPSLVVAKVAASTAAVRADGAAWLGRELDVAVFLREAGASVVPPSAEVPAVVQHGDGHVMTFWTYLEPSNAGLPDDATMGTLLRELHEALRSYPGPLQGLAPFSDIPAFLARPQTLLDADDVTAIAQAYTRLTSELAERSPAERPLHGDAGAGNLLPTGGGSLWHDFEDTCSGPVAWDLAASTASARRDRARIVAAYGQEVDARELRICEDLRRLHLTIWYSLYAERLPECRQRAAELAANWRSG